MEKSPGQGVRNWGEEKTIKFIQYYRDRECLWNTACADYMNKPERVAAYQNLLELMNDNKLTIRLVKNKIKNLRSVYHSELKKIQRSKDAGMQNVYKPTISWFYVLHAFLGDIALVHKARPKVKREVPPAPPEEIEFVFADSSRSSRSLDVSSPDQKETLYKRKRSHELDDSINIPDNIPNQSVYNMRHEDDEFHYFAMNVAAQLRAMPLAHALRAQAKISKLLYDARVDSDSDPIA